MSTWFIHRLQATILYAKESKSTACAKRVSSIYVSNFKICGWLCRLQDERCRRRQTRRRQSAGLNFTVFIPLHMLRLINSSSHTLLNCQNAACDADVTLWRRCDADVQSAVQHVINGHVVRACTYHTRALRHVRPLLTVDDAKMIATAIVGARLDYCNSTVCCMEHLNITWTDFSVVLLVSASATETRRQLLAAD